MLGDREDVAQSRVGSVIHDKYRVERLIGRGGMASVYSAVHLRVGNRVAIKILHPELSTNADLRARFLREGYVANKVDHRGAVRVLDDETADDGAACLVMELLEGQTVRALSEGRGMRLPHREVCEIAYQVLDVLAAAHDNGIVHRDIKPDNLFRTNDGVLKVLDFGIARLREVGSVGGATQTGQMMGTPAFMPPEQALGRAREIDGQTDLWAVGATVFALASGQFVHAAETPQEMIVRAGSRPARSVAAVTPDLSPAIAAVVDRALAFDKVERWPNARAMQAALAEAYVATFRVPMPGGRASATSSMAQLTETATLAERFASKPLSTTAGVVSLQSPREVAGVPRSRARRGLLVGVALAAPLAIGGGLALRGRTAIAPSRPSPATTIAAPAFAVPTVTATTTATAAEALPASATSTEPQAVALPTPAPLGASAPTAGGRPTTHPHPAPTPKPASSAAAAWTPQASAAPAAPVPKVNCNPPYFIDADGHRQYKRECL
jgi:eukaryotic-like serine/threonine-protein kinase